MFVRLRLGRHSGRRVSADGLPALEGELRILRRGGVLVAELCRPMTMSAEPLASLFDVRLVGLASSTLFLRGFEAVAGMAVLQEWHCECVDVSAGFDAAGRRLQGERTEAVRESGSE